MIATGLQELVERCKGEVRHTPNSRASVQKRVYLSVWPVQHAKMTYTIGGRISAPILEVYSMLHLTREPMHASDEAQRSLNRT